TAHRTRRTGPPPAPPGPGGGGPPAPSPGAGPRPPRPAGTPSGTTRGPAGRAYTGRAGDQTTPGGQTSPHGQAAQPGQPPATARTSSIRSPSASAVAAMSARLTA